MQPHEILSIRDEYFLNTLKRKKILKKVKEKFGINAIKNTSNEMTKIKLKRKVIEEATEEKKVL